MKTVNWGILGTGKIAAKFAEDLQIVENANLMAVGSRSLEGATKFAAKFNINHVHPSYQQLANNTEVDIIYIGTPHTLHKENSILCLENNKAVLCEKPIGVNTKELEEMLAVAKRKNLFLMEALWSYFLPTIQKAQEWIGEGRIGKVLHLKADFGFKAPYHPEKRLFNPQLAGGALLDVGIYPLAFALLFAQSEIHDVQASGMISATKVDLTDSYQLKFQNNVIADLSCSLGHNFENNAFIYGSEGYIKLPLFWKGEEAILHAYANNHTESFKDKRKTNGYNFEAQEATNMIIQGNTESQIMPHSSSFALLTVMDEIRSLINLKYPFEK